MINTGYLFRKAYDDAIAMVNIHKQCLEAQSDRNDAKSLEFEAELYEKAAKLEEKDNDNE